MVWRSYGSAFVTIAVIRQANDGQADKPTDNDSRNELFTTNVAPISPSERPNVVIIIIITGRHEQTEYGARSKRATRFMYGTVADKPVNRLGGGT